MAIETKPQSKLDPVPVPPGKAPVSSRGRVRTLLYILVPVLAIAAGLSAYWRSGNPGDKTVSPNSEEQGSAPVQTEAPVAGLAENVKLAGNFPEDIFPESSASVGALSYTGENQANIEFQSFYTAEAAYASAVIYFQGRGWTVTEYIKTNTATSRKFFATKGTWYVQLDFEAPTKSDRAIIREMIIETNER